MLKITSSPNTFKSGLRFQFLARFSFNQSFSAFDPELFKKSDHYIYFKRHFINPEYMSIIQQKIQNMGRAERISASIYINQKTKDGDSKWNNPELLYFLDNEEFSAEFFEEVQSQKEILNLSETSRVLEKMQMVEDPEEIKWFLEKLREESRNVNDPKDLEFLSNGFMVVMASAIQMRMDIRPMNFTEEIKAITDLAESNSWIDGDVISHLIAMLFYSQCEQQEAVMNRLVELFKESKAISELNFSRMMIMAFMSLESDLEKPAVDLDLESRPEPKLRFTQYDQLGKPGTIRYQVAKQGARLTECLPDLLSVRVLSKLNKIGFHEDWESQAGSGTFMQNYPRLIDVIRDPVLREFSALRRRMFESIAWKFAHEPSHPNFMEFAARSESTLDDFEENLLDTYIRVVTLNAASFYFTEKKFRTFPIFESIYSNLEISEIQDLENFPFKGKAFFDTFVKNFEVEEQELAGSAPGLLLEMLTKATDSLTFILNLGLHYDKEIENMLDSKKIFERGLIFSLKGYKAIIEDPKMQQMDLVYKKLDDMSNLDEAERNEIIGKLKTLDQNTLFEYAQLQSKMHEYQKKLKNLISIYHFDEDSENSVVKEIAQFLLDQPNQG